MRRMFSSVAARLGLALAFATPALAGCLGGGTAADGGFEPEADDALLVDGLVVDSEFFPVADALVVLEPGEWQTRSEDDGTFTLGPLTPGPYTLHVEREGYLAAERDLQVAPGLERVVVDLTPTSRNVPYHEFFTRVAFIDCTWSAAGVVAPCVPIDAATGQNITGDQSTFEFTIPNPDLANMLTEMDWESQATGERMFLVFLPPGTTSFAEGVTPFYYANSGSPPLRGWLWPGEIAEGGDTPFEGEEGTGYHVKIRASTEGETVPVSVFIQHRVEFWFTFFYNRPGPETFTALPDE